MKLSRSRLKRFRPFWEKKNKWVSKYFTKNVKCSSELLLWNVRHAWNAETETHYYKSESKVVEVIEDEITRSVSAIVSMWLRNSLFWSRSNIHLIFADPVLPCKTQRGMLEAHCQKHNKKTSTYQFLERKEKKSLWVFGILSIFSLKLGIQNVILWQRI